MEMQRREVRTMRWLVHPSNTVSLAFSRRVLPDADETYPPDDRPYVSFAILLA